MTDAGRQWVVKGHVQALYDYAPKRPIEIGFAKGDIITVFSNEGNWWIGELRGTTGKFPSNYVKVIPEPEPEPTDESAPPPPETSPPQTSEATTHVEELKAQAKTEPPPPQREQPPQQQPQQNAGANASGSANGNAIESGSPDAATTVTAASVEPARVESCMALFNYTAQRDVEISFKKGDVIRVISMRGKWWEGELNGVKGRLPSNYVRALPPSPFVAAAAPAAQQQVPPPPSSTAPAMPPRSTATKAATRSPPSEPAPAPLPRQSRPHMDVPPPPAPPEGTPATSAPDSSVGTAASPELGEEEDQGTADKKRPTHRHHHDREHHSGSRKYSTLRANKTEVMADSSVKLGAPPPPPPRRDTVAGDYIAPPPMFGQPPPPPPSHAAEPVVVHRPTPIRTTDDFSSVPHAVSPSAPVHLSTRTRSHSMDSSAQAPIIATTHAAGAAPMTKPSPLAAPVTPRSTAISVNPPPAATAQKQTTQAPSVPAIDMRSTIGPAAGHVVSQMAMASPNSRLGPDTRFATVRLRAAPQMAGITDSSNEISDEYMSMMKWNAEYVPNLTRSLLQDQPSIPMAVSPGDAIPPPSMPPPPMDLNSTQRYYIFSEPDTSTNLRSAGGEIIAATLPKLIGKLTDVSMPNGKESIQAFLMTYRTFAEPMIVLDLLATRFEVPSTLPEDQQETIQIRVWYFLKEWITTLIDDFVEFVDLNVKVHNLIERMCGSTRPSVAHSSLQLRAMLDQKLAGATSLNAPVPPFGAPKPLHPNGQIKSVLDIPSLEIARQLTIMKFEVFRKIKPKELCNLAWTKKDALTRAPNIVHFIKYFNKMGQWVTTMLLQETDVSHRKKVLKHMLHIAEDCRELQNYNSMMEIIAAISSAPIARMKRTWSSKTNDRLKTFEKLMAKNFKELREVIATALPPCIPYIGLYFTDLVFIEEGNPNYLADAPNMINWTKAMMSSRIMLQIMRFQQKGFALFQELATYDWLSNSIKEATMNEQQAYQRSLELEPRERK